MVRTDKGEICGLITLENILETIVGDIKDEYDIPPEYLYDINETRLLAGGGISLQALRERLGPSVPELNKTLCQWLLEIADKPLKVESSISFNGIRYEIRKMSRSKISEIIIDFADIVVPEENNLSDSLR
jgi:putative hemolysin